MLLWNKSMWTTSCDKYVTYSSPVKRRISLSLSFCLYLFSSTEFEVKFKMDLGKLRFKSKVKYYKMAKVYDSLIKINQNFT